MQHHLKLPCGGMVVGDDTARVLTLYDAHLRTCREDPCILEFYRCQEDRRR